MDQLQPMRQLSADFKEMREWFANTAKVPRTVERARREISLLHSDQVQSQGSALYKGVLSLLALQGSIDFNTGQALENARSNDKDHLFPKREFSSKNDLNSVLNITWMSEETNRKIKRYEKPSEYIPRFISEKYSTVHVHSIDFVQTPVHHQTQTEDKVSP